MKKNIIRNIDPFHDEIEIDRDVEINFEIYSELKETPLNKNELVDESSKTNDQSEIHEKENCKNSITQESRDKTKNIPHEARYSIQLEKTKALNAQHGSIFLKSPKEDRRSDPMYKMNKPKSLIENISNNIPKQSTTSETINQEFLKRLQATTESESTPKIKSPKTLKCRNSMKISSRRNFSKNKMLFSLRKTNTKLPRNQSKMPLTIKEIVEEISAALFDSEEFVKKFQNLVNVITKDTKKTLENQIDEPKIVCDFNSKENNLKETKNSDLTDFNAKIFKTRQPEAIIHELIESIKERYRHHNHLPAKFIFPIIYDEPENLIHKYEFLTYETYLKTSISCDPNYKMICSNRSMTPRSLKILGKTLNTNQAENANNWDDDESRLVINEEIVDQKLPKTINTSSENLTNQLQNEETPGVTNKNTPNQTESTIDSIRVHETQNRKTPNVNIILKPPSVTEQNLPDSPIPVNLASHLLENPEISASNCLMNNGFKTKLINQIDGDNHMRLPKVRKLDEHNPINYNGLHLRQIEEFERKKALEHRKAFKNLISSPDEYNKNNSTPLQKLKLHTESLNDPDYVHTGNGSKVNSIGAQQQPHIRNNYSNPVREQMHPSSGHYNHPQFPINLMVDPSASNNNNGIERGLNFIPQTSQNKIPVSYPKYPLMSNADTKILEYRLQHSSPTFQQPCNLSGQTHNQIFDFSRNNPQRQCLQVNGIIPQQPISSNLGTNSRVLSNELIQYQQHSQFNSISQVNYQSKLPTLSNNRQYTGIDPGLSNHIHPSTETLDHFNQPKFYYNLKESHQVNYDQSYTQQYGPHNGNSSRSISETQSKQFSTK